MHATWFMFPRVTRGERLRTRAIMERGVTCQRIEQLPYKKRHFASGKLSCLEVLNLSCTCTHINLREIEMDSIKIAVLGESGVGKSALAVRMITGRFLHHYDPTLEDEYHTEVHANGEKRSISIMDTAGQVSIFKA